MPNNNRVSVLLQYYCKNTETRLSEIQDKQQFILFIGPFLSQKNLHMTSVYMSRADSQHWFCALV